MAKKVDTLANELKSLVKTGKAIIGTERTLKLLRAQKLKQIYLSSNCPVEIEEEVNRLAGDVKIEKLNYPNDELGLVCKKEFSISILGILK